MSDWNAEIIEEFRANSGKVGGMFEGAPMLILHTKGARTGADRETPLMYLPLEDRLFIFASAAGADSHPDWYYNCVANPEIEVEIGEEKLGKRVVELDRDGRDTTYAEQARRYPGFAEYEAKTDRVIPVFELV